MITTLSKGLNFVLTPVICGTEQAAYKHPEIQAEELKCETSQILMKITHTHTLP